MNKPDIPESVIVVLSHMQPQLRRRQFGPNGERETRCEQLRRIGQELIDFAERLV